jgi:hypothetical protein
LPNDVGADEVSDAPAKNKPLQPGDVGPSWRKSEKTASAEAMQVRRATYAAQSAPTPQPAPLPVDPRGGRDPIYFTAHPDLFLRYERESRSFVMKGPRGWGATSVTLCPQIVGQRTVWAVDVEHEDERGKARAFEVQSDAGEQRFWTYDDHPMLFTRVTVRNATSAPIELKQLVPLVVRLKTAPPTLRAQQLRLFGADGPTTAEEGKTAEGALAVVEREGSFGLVAGWVAPKQVRSATVSATYDGKITVEGRSEYENVKIAPGEALTSETFAIGFAEDAPEGLKRLAAR